jgi:tetratricopeptide (TPR) repeat protein
MYKSLFLFLFGGVLVLAQDPAPPATYPFEKDAVYLEKKKLLLTQINQSPSVQRLDSLTQWAALHKDWETVLDYAPQALTLSPTASRYYKWGGAAGFRSLEVPRFLALPYVDKMKEGFTKAHQLAPKNTFILRALIETYAVLPSLLGGDLKMAWKKAEALSAINFLEGAMAHGYIAEIEKQPTRAKIHYEKAFALLKELQSSDEWQWEKYRRELPYELGSVSARFQINRDVGKTLLLHYLEQYGQKDTVPLAWVYFHLGTLAQAQKDVQQAFIYYKKAQGYNPKLEGLNTKLKEVGP